MPDEIDHEEARRTAALRQPNHVLAQPYLDLTEKLEAAHAALLQIADLAGQADMEGAVSALNEIERIAHASLPERKVLPVAKLKDVQE